MLTIYLVKKEKGRVYKSADIVRAFFSRKLQHDEDGAPHFADCQPAGPADPERYISITDTKNYWACCVSEKPVGIDMEEQGRVVKPAIAKRFHKAEQEYLSVLSEGSREWTEEFFAIWTKKEAWSKLKGKGYAIGFSKFSVLEAETEGIPVASFTYGQLIFGIAGDSRAEIVPRVYDAPMEKSALDYAAGLLDARAYSSESLSKKLSDRGYTDEEASQAIEKLKGYGYINDEAYASELARRAAESGKGRQRIKMELREKGIGKELAEEAAQEFAGSEYDRAKSAALKMLGMSPAISTYSADGGSAAFGTRDPEEAFSAEDLTPEQKKELRAKRQKLVGKVTRKLASLGYDASVIWSVIEDLGL
ncbi:MAG: RecX family transcriptional regulator [Firmicutes bacterium]|nr:RecX family transcriptional regulator [Bacillota bacterium]